MWPHHPGLAFASSCRTSPARGDVDGQLGLPSLHPPETQTETIDSLLDGAIEINEAIAKSMEQ